MERPEHPTADYVREVGWALLLINLFAGAVGLLVGVHMSSISIGLALFLGGSLSVTALLALVVASTLAWDAAAQARTRRDRRRTHNCLLWCTLPRAKGSNAARRRQAQPSRKRSPALTAASRSQP